MAREMKNSGIEWIGNIPAHWEMKRLKSLFLERKEKNDPVKTDFILSLGASYGVVPYSEKEGGGNKAKEDLTDYRLAYPNDIVMNSMNIISGSVGISRYFGCVSPVYYMLYPRQDNVDPDFYCYLFQTKAFQKSLLGLGNGILMKESSNGTFNTVRMRIPMEKLGVQPIPMPSLKEQKKIASYLNIKCAEIDDVIKKTEATIEEYKSLKRVLIAEKVSKGLSENSDMKDSGVEWIGDIPAHWKVRKGKWILSRLERPVQEDDGVITCFRDGEVTLRSKRREEGFTFSLQEVGYQGIEQGDLVVHGMDGFAGAIGISDSRGKGTPVLNVLDSTENKKYIMYYLRNMAYNGIFLALSTGIRVRSCDTNWNKLKELPYLVPSLEEQKEISDYLDKKCDEIDALISAKTALLEELETYKKSVIYEYTTGKKEVC
ncbi:MAG: restriction endonuclease subunit S [Clostridia bacterium]|nr:restriction endonuclease subunit S [Clostridia bacterium]